MQGASVGERGNLRDGAIDEQHCAWNGPPDPGAEHEGPAGWTSELGSLEALVNEAEEGDRNEQGRGKSNGRDRELVWLVDCRRGQEDHGEHRGDNAREAAEQTDGSEAEIPERAGALGDQVDADEDGEGGDCVEPRHLPGLHDRQRQGHGSGREIDQTGGSRLGVPDQVLPEAEDGRRDDPGENRFHQIVALAMTASL